MQTDESGGLETTFSRDSMSSEISDSGHPMETIKGPVCGIFGIYLQNIAEIEYAS